MQVPTVVVDVRHYGRCAASASGDCPRDARRKEMASDTRELAGGRRTARPRGFCRRHAERMRSAGSSASFPEKGHRECLAGRMRPEAWSTFHGFRGGHLLWTGGHSM